MPRVRAILGQADIISSVLVGDLAQCSIRESCRDEGNTMNTGTQ